MHKHQAYSLCRQYLHRYVVITTKDGRTHEGLIENVDRDNVYLVVPRGGMSGPGRHLHGKDGEDRQFFGPFGLGWGYSGYYPGYYPGYVPYYSYFPRRRWRRYALPLSFLTGVVLGSFL